jgi:hypothetical protein
MSRLLLEAVDYSELFGCRNSVSVSLNIMRGTTTSRKYSKSYGDRQKFFSLTLTTLNL